MGARSINKISRELREWQDLCQRITSATAQAINETETEKQNRIKGMTKPTAAAFEKFCNYYFPHYISCEFAWFHKRAANKLSVSQNKITVAEWPRGHAKSVFFNVFMPLWLLSRGELEGMILVSETEDKACTLLGDIQAEFTSNTRLIADFGPQSCSGAWSDGKFVTASGVGFWAFGVGQNPAGTRKAQRRPNYITVDDADSRKTAKNQELTKERVEWVRGELLGCVVGNKHWRMVIANNRVAKNGLTAHMVGDVTEADPINPDIIHIKAYAFEDPKTHKLLMPENGGKPAWPQRFTTEELQQLIKSFTWRPAMRNFFHQDIADGNIFKPEHIEWVKPLKPHQYQNLLSYTDPSFKGSKNNDFKARILMGLAGPKIHILGVWCRQASIGAMIDSNYEMHEQWERVPIHWMEANFLQSIILDEYAKGYETHGYHLPIKADKRPKEDKHQRIETLSALFERGVIQFSEKLQGTPDCNVLLDQLFAFPNGAHDDGPDAMEGGVWFLNRRIRATTTSTRMGKFKRNRSRTG